MTNLRKVEIIKNITSRSGIVLKKLKEFFLENEVLYNEIIRTHYSGYSKGWSKSGEEVGYYVSLILNLKIENDAPRGGLNGNYIIIKDNKKNKEEIEFIKAFLQIF